MANSTDRDVFEVSDSIVVGVDGSDSSLQALEWAAAQARVTGQRLVAITTWEWPASYGETAAWPSDVNFEEDAKKILRDGIAKTLGEDAIDVTQKVIHGHPAPVLVDLSKDAALVVVGSRGHGEFAGMLLGSVSEFLATHAHCPVVIVRHRSPRD